MSTGKTAFVTGGTGFVGSHLVEELLHRDYAEVRCLVRAELRWLEGMNVTPVRGTLFDDELIRDAVSDVDYVYHVGAVTRARAWSTFERENVLATLNLLDAVADAAPDVRRVLIISSLAAIGRCEAGIADENSPLNPISNYGRSKAQMEKAIWNGRDRGRSYADELPITILRPPSVYGPREADIFTMFKAASRGLFPVLGSGRQPDVSLIHVRDVVRGMIDAAESDRTRGETYFIGSERDYSWREVHGAMRTALGRRSIAVSIPPALVPLTGLASEFIGVVRGVYPPLNREKAREARWACKRCSTRKAKADFGFEGQISLERGFAETVKWYRTHGWL